ncbi:MAG: hypothetical protein WC455_21565 [Dehalococcoidia bacterium]|jgi:uncharacterized membrane protein
MDGTENLTNTGAAEAGATQSTQSTASEGNKETPTQPKFTQADVDKLLAQDRTQYGRDRKKLEEERKVFEAERAEIAATKHEIAVFNIAKEHKMNAEDLKAAAAEMQLDTPEQIKALAKRLAGKAGESFIPDSGRNTGGSKRVYTSAEVADYNFWKENKADIELARVEGRIKN